MATETRRHTAAVIEQLLEEPHRFDFFQAVGLLERASWQPGEKGVAPGLRPVGHDAPPEREAVRFRSLPSLRFGSAGIRQARGARRGAKNGGEGAAPPEMTVAFMGLTGPSGVLPQHYTELLIRRVRQKDFALRDFLDLFNHRLISLFYRAWEKYRFPRALERARLDRRTDDGFTTALASLAGFGTGGLAGRSDLHDETPLYYAGHFSHAPRSAAALEAMLSDYLGMPVRVEQFQGRWLRLGEGDRSRLSAGRRKRDCYNRLGVDTVIGERVWDIQGKFRLRLGPLSYRAFARMMPMGGALRRLCELTRSFVGPGLDFDVQVSLLGANVPECRLGGAGENAPRLGWNTWLRGETFAGDADDVIFSPAVP